MGRYDFYADMYATHSEIGYLLWLLLMLVLCDAGLAIAVHRWPPSDVYLVPGIATYGEVPVIWAWELPQAAAAAAPGLAAGAPKPGIGIPGDRR